MKPLHDAPRKFMRIFAGVACQRLHPVLWIPTGTPHMQQWQCNQIKREDTHFLEFRSHAFVNGRSTYPLAALGLPRGGNSTGPFTLTDLIFSHSFHTAILYNGIPDPPKIHTSHCPCNRPVTDRARTPQTPPNSAQDQTFPYSLP